MRIDKIRLIEVVKLIAGKLKDQTYAFRGTTSLVLQDIDMIADDIDIVCDGKTALLCNELLSDYLIERVEYKESPKFKSYFGKFGFDEVLVEIMGEWQIANGEGDWSEVINGEGNQSTVITINNIQIPVTKIETELKAYALMKRWNAYHKVKRQFDKSSLQQVLFV